MHNRKTMCGPAKSQLNLFAYYLQQNSMVSITDDLIVSRRLKRLKPAVSAFENGRSGTRAADEKVPAIDTLDNQSEEEGSPNKLVECFQSSWEFLIQDQGLALPPWRIAQSSNLPTFSTRQSHHQIRSKTVMTIGDLCGMISL